MQSILYCFWCAASALFPPSFALTLAVVCVCVCCSCRRKPHRASSRTTASADNSPSSISFLVRLCQICSMLLCVVAAGLVFMPIFHRNMKAWVWCESGRLSQCCHCIHHVRLCSSYIGPLMLTDYMLHFLTIFKITYSSSQKIEVKVLFFTEVKS